jgi:hypothetical protein
LEAAVLIHSSSINARGERINIKKLTRKESNKEQKGDGEYKKR